MILDAFLQFDPPTTLLTSVAASGVSTNIIDLHNTWPTSIIPSLVAGQGARDIGVGDDTMLQLLVQLGPTAATGGTSIQVSFQGAPDNGSNAPGTWTTYASGPVVALASMVPGARLFDDAVPRPPPGITFPRFVRLSYTVVGTFTGTSTITSYIVGQRFDQPAGYTSTAAVLGGYAPGFTVPN